LHLVDKLALVPVPNPFSPDFGNRDYESGTKGPQPFVPGHATGTKVYPQDEKINEILETSLGECEIRTQDPLPRA
jgi:hypothetical protein